MSDNPIVAERYFYEHQAEMQASAEANRGSMRMPRHHAGFRSVGKADIGHRGIAPRRLPSR